MKPLTFAASQSNPHTRKTMRILARVAVATLVAAAFISPALAADPPKKNWTAPAGKSVGQKLVDETWPSTPSS